MTFHFRNNFLDKCVVDMKLPPGNIKNQHCIKKILQSYKVSDKVYFIWLVHGWIWKMNTKRPDMENLKDSYFTRYPEKSQ